MIVSHLPIAINAMPRPNNESWVVAAGTLEGGQVSVYGKGNAVNPTISSIFFIQRQLKSDHLHQSGRSRHRTALI